MLLCFGVLVLKRLAIVTHSFLIYSYFRLSLFALIAFPVGYFVVAAVGVFAGCLGLGFVEFVF